jgi:hypothetical protein
MLRLRFRLVLNSFLWLSMAGLTHGQERQIGELLVTLTGASAPRVLAEGQDRLDPPSDRYWVVADVTFQNVGNVPICAHFTSALRADVGLAGRPGFLAKPAVSDLQPNEEAKTRFVFTLARGAKPLELTVATADYGTDCGDRLLPSAASSVRFPIEGLASQIKTDPDGRVIAGVFYPAHPPVYIGIDQLRRDSGREQDVIEAHAFIGLPAVSLVVPEGPEGSLGVEAAEGIGPALIDESRKGVAAFRLDEGVAVE